MALPDTSLSSQTDGSALPWILEHLLAYPASYEIPLRTTYTLNTAPRAQPLPYHPHQSSMPSLLNGSGFQSSPRSPQLSSEEPQQFITQAASEYFKSCLMEQISQLPSQPFSLPPSFITAFVRRCFPEDLCSVDFTQALTALDYLKDLENRRKRELAAALRRLDISKDTAGKTIDDVAQRYPRVAEWVSSMESKERNVEALYTQVYIGLRLWTLINEMRLEPFNKANCIAMLNTLYPPVTNKPPTSQITPTMLANQRNGFFRYIQGVEKNGKQVLETLECKSARKGDENGWPEVRRIVDNYLRAANGVIDECATVTGTGDFRPTSEDSHPSVSSTGRRIDSGISFGSDHRPSTSSSTTSKILANKPLPASPVLPQAPTSRKGSTLERIARELRKMRSKNEIKEAAKQEEEEPRKGRSLKKMKSSGALGRSSSKPRHGRCASDDLIPEFKIDDAQRERLIREATWEKENRAPSGEKRR